MARLPSKSDVLRWIADNPTLTSKRDIAKAFGIRGSDRIDLKRLLRELEEEGHLEKRRKNARKNFEKKPRPAKSMVAARL